MKHSRLLVLAFSAVFLVAVAPPASAQADQINEKIELEIDWHLTPADYPCLEETIHLTGTVEDSLHVVITPSGGYSWQNKETGAYKGLTAIGMTTGAEYRFRGPYSYVENGSTDEPWVTWYPLEWTFNVHNYFMGPQDFYMRILWHVTYDRETGELKLETYKEDVTCK